MFLKNRNIISKMKRSEVTDYAALMKQSPVRHIRIISEAIIELQYESRMNIFKSYCKVRASSFECLGYSAYILEFYIAFDIILICLTGDCFINKPL